MAQATTEGEELAGFFHQECLVVGVDLQAARQVVRVDPGEAGVGSAVAAFDARW